MTKPFDHQISRRTCSARRPSRSLCLHTVIPLTLLLGACSADVVNMGEGEQPLGVPSDSRCLESATLAGDVTVANQEELNQLEGCEVIDGSLNVLPFIDADLRPLHALRAVSGLLSFSDPTPEGGWSRPSYWCETTECVFWAGPPSDFETLYESGWLASLEGLESLERAGGLRIRGLSAATLDPLANVRSLSGAGGISLTDCPNLQDLNGLSHVRGILDLEVACENLETLAPLSLAQQMSSLRIEGSRLADMGSFGVRSVSNSFRIANTALQDLDALSSLTSVGNELTVWGNPVLEDLSGLNALSSAGGMTVSANPRLQRFPELTALTALNSLFIEGNLVLDDLSAFAAAHPSTHPGPNYLSVHPFSAARTDYIEIGGNPELERFVMPFPWGRSQTVRITGNAKLREIDMGALQGIEMLSIIANPLLEQVNLGRLATVDVLEVLNNPQLPTSAFDSVQTFQAKVRSDNSSD
jgi:hypothetical protein